MNDRRANNEQRRASDPGASAWVNANAGSGKTHVLIDRLIRLMLAGCEPARILCLTYTKAAAAEMATRLFERLGKWATLADAALAAELEAVGVAEATPALLAAVRRLFAAALETPGGLKIQTIHAFCERLLQLFPVEAGIVPHFTVLDDRKAGELMARARNATLRAAQTHPESAEGRAMACIAASATADQFEALLNALVADRAAIHGFLDTGDGLTLAETLLRQKLDLQPTDDMATIRGGLALDSAAYKRLAAALAGGSGADLERANLITEVLAGPAPDLTRLRGLYLTTKDEPKKISSIATKPVRTSAPWVEGFVTDEQDRLTTGLGKLADLAHLEATLALLTVAAAVEARYTAAKREAGAHDFGDLIFHTEQLLAAKPDAAWVLYKLDGGIEHILLDEAQDTSPAQWSIIASLTEEFFAGEGRPRERPRSLFAVGDRKQSIFSFQGADPAIFETMHGAFRSRITDSGQAFNDVDFTVSFRSLPIVLEAVDTVFAEGAAARHGLDGGSEGLIHEPRRREHPGTFEVWPLVEPVDGEDQEPWQAPVDRPPANAPAIRLARQIAGRIRSWVGARQVPALGRTVNSGDILILVRRRGLLFDALIRELRNAKLPVAGADRLELGDTLAVADLLALARFCLLQEDDYSLACVLKSPIPARAVSEDELFTAASGRDSRSLWQALRQKNFPQVAELEDLIALAATARPYEFFATVLARARVRIVSRLGGEANDALDSFLEQAILHEQDAGSSLQDFVQWFASGRTEIRRDMEQAAGEIRVMTVHGAKGLEAPIVILPDTTGAPEPVKHPLMMIDIGAHGIRLPLWRLAHQFKSRAMSLLLQARSEDAGEEHRRLLYVAMTRARDELHVAGYSGKREIDAACWYNLVKDAVVAPRDGKGPFARAAEEGVLRAGADPVFADRLPQATPAEVTVPQWVAGPIPAEAEPPVFAAPSRAMAEGPPEAASPAAARGRVIHAILQILPDMAPPSRDEVIRRMVARAGEEPETAAEILAIANDPEFSFVLGPEGLSEVPVRAGFDGAGRPISGRIDRLIPDGPALTVIDYKTDRSPPETAEATPATYLAQMAAYEAALRAIHPNHDISCAILWTAGPRLMQIPPALLALHNPVARP